MSFDHPVHPATVHWPIAFWSLAYGLDLVYGATTYLRLPFLVSNLAYSLPDLGKAAYYLNILGVITALPATSTGVQQALQIYKNGGLYEADGKTVRQKMKIVIAHAAFNDVILAAGVYQWWSRAADAAPTGLDIAISAVMLPALLWSANLGGTLVYNYGAGLNILAGKKKN